MNTMKHIEYLSPLFRATTYGVDRQRPNDVEIVDSFLAKAGKGVELGILANDEVPLFFACPGVLGASKIDLNAAVSEEFEKKLHAAITQFNLRPEALEVYMGPCLTFSHTHVERALIENLMDRGYRAACKRTDGVDFVDVPMMILVQCRRLGIPMANIHIGDYDTFENPNLLYSKLRGDQTENLTVATLL